MGTKNNIFVYFVLFLFLMVAYLFFSKRNDATKKEKEFAVQDYQIELLHQQSTKLQIEYLKQLRRADSLKEIISNYHHDKAIIKNKYIHIKDSIRNLPLDESMEFFSNNLSEEDSN